MQLIARDVEVGEVVVLLLDLEVALGELVVLTFDRAELLENRLVLVLEARDPIDQVQAQQLPLVRVDRRLVLARVLVAEVE